MQAAFAHDHSTAPSAPQSSLSSKAPSCQADTAIFIPVEQNILVALLMAAGIRGEDLRRLADAIDSKLVVTNPNVAGAPEDVLDRYLSWL